MCMNLVDGEWLACSPRGFEPWSGQIKDYKISICCFFDKHAALWRKSKDWLSRNQVNVSETEWWRHVYPQTVVSVIYHYKIPTKHFGLVQSGPHHHLIEN
jgi:hypothetical protein